jgi:hypothetical protein
LKGTKQSHSLFCPLYLPIRRVGESHSPTAPIRSLFPLNRSTMQRGVRRPPPSHLRLAPPGPVPRGTPRHKLPSIPLPTFQPAAQIPKTTSQRPSIITESVMMISPVETYSSPRSSGESEWSLPWGYQYHSASSSTSSLASFSSPCHSPSKVSLRGPWDHSTPIQIDVERILAVPKPVAISP